MKLFGSKNGNSTSYPQVKNQQLDSASFRRNNQALGSFGYPQQKQYPPSIYMPPPRQRKSDITFIKAQKRMGYPMPMPFSQKVKVQQNSILQPRSNSRPSSKASPFNQIQSSTALSNSKVSQKPVNNTGFFIFPKDQFKLMKFGNPQQVLEFLNNGMQSLGQQYGGRCYTQKPLFNMISYKCEICECKITFSRTDGFKLTRFENRHNHSKMFSIIQKQDPSHLKYYMDIPFIEGQFMNTDLRFKIQQKFKISKQKAKLIAQKFFKNYMDLDFILQKISKEHQVLFKKFYNQQQRESSAVLMVTQKMKQRYKKYGYMDSIIIDLRKRLLTNVNENGKLWQVLFIYGQDMDLNIILFGVCLIADRTPQMYFRVMNQFFLIMGNERPYTIIMKDNSPLRLALQEINKDADKQITITRQKMKKKSKNKQIQNQNENENENENNQNFQSQNQQNEVENQPEQVKIVKYSFMSDWRGKLRKVRQHLRSKKYSQDEIKNMIIWFGQLLQQPSRQRYQKILLQNKIHKIEDQVVEEFLKNKNQSCLSHIPEHMCGFTPSTNRNDMYNEMIKKNFKPGQNFAKFFFGLMSFEISQNEREAKYHSAMSKKNRFEQLQKVLARLQGKIGDKMLENYKDVVDMDAIKRDDQGFQFQVVFKGICESLTFRDDRWHCTCGYNPKIGIPCMHQLKIIGRNDGKIIKHINPRWLKPTPKMEYTGEGEEPDSVLDKNAFPMKTEPKQQQKTNKGINSNQNMQDQEGYAASRMQVQQEEKNDFNENQYSDYSKSYKLNQSRLNKKID